MGLLAMFRRRRTPYRAVDDEEAMARYVYLLGTLPASVIESAHASAFRDVPADKRREMFEQLRPFLAESERDAASDDPVLLARLLRRAEERRAQRAEAGTAAAAPGTLTLTAADDRDGVRDARDSDPRDLLLSAGVLVVVANQFLVSAAVASYFTVGAGSLALDSSPAWVGETFDPGSAGFDTGGAGGFDGGSGDAAGFGGFDGGGFGGFDGGGGFGG